MKFGLTKKDLDSISAVFASHPEVDEVIIYGSRVKGNFKRGSDIDLTLKGSKLRPCRTCRAGGEGVLFEGFWEFEKIAIR